uniref:Permease often clustered with de novo purine synthesis n=1 Tax=uncultured Thiotrichaceae bacterium TaxID=298394 RepID=A0A6S6SM84_9GAMM|nr:MAG: Putative permease often clustered with de novo purine synthesis [uncultured Thiotrichaceae bacterium]
MTFDGRFWFWIFLAVLSVALITLLSPILMPFVAGALIAYLADPLADRLEALKLSRILSVTIVFIVGFGVILLLLLVLIPVLSSQLQQFAEFFSDNFDGTIRQIFVPYLEKQFGIDPSVLGADQLISVVSSNLKEAGGFAGKAIQTISRSGFAVLGWAANLVMIPIISFYLLRDWDKLVAYIHDLLPRDIEPVVSQLAKDSDEMLGAFLRGQFLVMLALSIIYSLGLWMIGLDFALLIGFIAGLVSFVPYLGLIVGIAIAGLAILFQTGDAFQLFWVFVVFGAAQMVEGVLLTPLLVGERIGLHPVAVIFAVLAGGQLFGFFGILLALPIAAVLAVLMRHLHDSYKQSQIYRINVD